MHQPWRTFAALINRGLSGKTSSLDKLRLSRADYLINSWRNKIRMHTSKDDYLINSLIFVSAKESTQIYRAILLECLTSPAMKESKAYKTYLGYATGAVHPKMARKFKKASLSKKDSDLVLVDEEPVTKGKQVKRPAKKSTTKPAAGVVIREAPVETKSKSKEKKKVDVTRGKGIELLSKVALTEEAQMKEVRKKSLRDFHKTHPSGYGVPDCGLKMTLLRVNLRHWGNVDNQTANNDKIQLMSNEESNDVNKSESDDVIKAIKKSVIEALIKEACDEVTLAKVSSQPYSTYEAASTLTEFELKKILIDKIEKSESYLAAPEHRDCYDSLKKSYDLDKDFFFCYDVYSLKRSHKDKDKDEDPSAGSDRGLKKRKLSKDAEPTTVPKKKDSTSGPSKGTKSQLKSSEKSVQSEEPVFKVADSDMPQDQ
ncbi:hypothetical protein Tco_0378984 [Tanacetum coccineum]